MDDQWTADNISKMIENLIVRMTTVANEDDVITDEEQDIIDTMTSELRGLEQNFVELQDQDLSKDQLGDKSIELFEQVITNTTAQAKRDGTITSDELIIIDRLAKFLRSQDITEYSS